MYALLPFHGRGIKKNKMLVTTALIFILFYLLYAYNDHGLFVRVITTQEYGIMDNGLWYVSTPYREVFCLKARVWGAKTNLINTCHIIPTFYDPTEGGF